LNKNKQQQNNYSARTKEEVNSNREYNLGTFLAAKERSPRTVKVADYQVISNLY
jgi:hypothetical protein